MEKTKKPKVSVIVPCYNHAHYLKESISSVLNQTLKNFEIILIDDGSKDNSAEIAKELAKKDKRIRFFQHKKNMGLTRTFNDGLRLCRGKYIGQHAADDLMHPQNLEKRIKIMEKYPDVGIVFSDYSLISEKGKVVRKSTSDIYSKGYIGKNVYYEFLLYCAAPPSDFARKEVYDKVGFYDEKLPIAEDRDIRIRMFKYFKTAYINEPLFLFRVNVTNPSYMGRATLADREYSELRIAKKNIDTLRLTKRQENLIYSYVYYALLRVSLTKKRRNLKKAVIYFLKLLYFEPFFLPKRIFGKIMDMMNPQMLPWIVLHDAEKIKNAKIIK